MQPITTGFNFNMLQGSIEKRREDTAKNPVAAKEDRVHQTDQNWKLECRINDRKK